VISWGRHPVNQSSWHHPFTASGGIGACAETPQAGKRLGFSASPFMGKLAAKRTEGVSKRRKFSDA